MAPGETTRQREAFGISDKEIGIYISNKRILEDFWDRMKKSKAGRMAILKGQYRNDPAGFARAVMELPGPEEYSSFEFVYFPAVGEIRECPVEEWSIMARLEFNVATGIAIDGFDLILPDKMDPDKVPEDGNDLLFKVIEGYNQDRAKEAVRAISQRRARDSGYNNGQHNLSRILN